MSVRQYQKYREKKGNKITEQAITKAIRKGHRTPGVIGLDMFGGTYILYVDIKELDNFLVAIKKPNNLAVLK